MGAANGSPKDEPEQVEVYDFIGDAGKAIPYGAYNVAANAAWMSVGRDHDTAAFAAQTGLTIIVCHLPPGTSEWNKIEHRLVSHISMNWRRRPWKAMRPSSSSSQPPAPAPGSLFRPNS